MSSQIRSHRDLIAWRKAFELGLRVYRATKDFPPDERFGLISQLRRGGVAVASNIAEGYGRGSTADYLRYLRIARGALYEIDTQLLFAHQLGYLNKPEHNALQDGADECGRVLAGLIRSIENDTKRQPVPSAQCLVP